MKKLSLFAVFLCFLFNAATSQTASSASKTWDYIQGSIHFVDSAVVAALPGHYSFKHGRAKIKSVSPTDKKIKRNIKVRYKNGNVTAREFYKIGDECGICI